MDGKVSKIFIGIDPDIKDNGIACWDSELKAFDYIKNMTFWDVIGEFELWNIEINVVIEAGWLIKKSNWHGKAGQSKSVGEKIAKSVGRNHQIGILIAEYCELNDINYKLIKPQGKVNSDYFKKLTGYTKRTNQDQRDAAMLVYELNKI